MSDNLEDAKRKKVLQRVRAAMARTVANGCTEAEAAAAADLVDRLMAEYEIDLTETTVGEQEIVRVDIALNHHPVRWSATNLATFCDCKVWTDKVRGEMVVCFLGLEIDTEIAEYLFLMFQRAIDRETANYTMFNPDLAMVDAASVKVKADSFGAGMATRLGERLLHMKSSRDFTQRQGGFDLVLSKKSLIDEAWGTLGITLSQGAGYSSKDRAAFEQGKAAGDKVAINPGVRGSAGASNGRIR